MSVVAAGTRVIFIFRRRFLLRSFGRSFPARCSLSRLFGGLFSSNFDRFVDPIAEVVIEQCRSILIGLFAACGLGGCGGRL
jgi:hypothetical protein